MYSAEQHTLKLQLSEAAVQHSQSQGLQLLQGQADLLLKLNLYVKGMSACSSEDNLQQLTFPWLNFPCWQHAPYTAMYL